MRIRQSMRRVAFPTVAVLIGIGASIPSAQAAPKNDGPTTVDPSSPASQVADIVFTDAAEPSLQGGDPATGGAAPAVMSPAASGCKTITTTARAENVFGSTLYTFKQSSTWCYSGGQITYRYSDAVGDPQFLGYKYEGILDQSNSGPGNPWIRYREGHFDQCSPTPWGETCTNDSYPWIRHTMYANGTYSIQHGIA